MRLLTICIALAPSLAGAQSNVAWSFFAGTTSGTLLSSSPSYAPVNGVTAGVAWTVPIARFAAVEVGAAFVQKGGRVQGTGVRMDYIETPVSLRISDEETDDPIRAFVRVGVATSIKRRCEVLEQILVNQPAVRRVLATSIGPVGDACDTIRSPAQDVGPLAGVGFVFREETLRFTLEVRHTGGLSLKPFGSDENLKPSTISLLAGLGWAR